MKKQHTPTDTLLTLGMALYADKRTMEQRVRGIFARRRSARFAYALTVCLCLAVGLGCFTTACKPVRADGLRTVGGTPVENMASIQADAGPASVTPTPTPLATLGRVEGPETMLAGLAEAPFVPVQAPERIACAAEAIGANRRFAVDAAVAAPEVTGYSVSLLTRRALTLADYRTYLAYLAPDADWRVYDPVTETAGARFPDGLAEAAMDFTLHAPGENGGTYTFSGTLPGGLLSNVGVYFCKYDGVAWESDLRAYGDERNELRYFTADWPVSESDARALADKAVAGLGIEHVAFASMEKAIAGAGGGKLASKGWLVRYERSNNGLTVPDCGGMFASQRNDIAYNTPMTCRLWMYIDETGIAQLDWRNPCEQAEPAIRNVSILPPEAVPGLLLSRLRTIYESDANAERIPETTFTVKEIRLVAAIIGRPWTITDGNPMGDDEATDGLLVPAWEAVTEISFLSNGVDAYSHTEIYAFNAIDGGGLVGKQP